jgi:4-carboxymuconolactone decarboxylase
MCSLVVPRRLLSTVAADWMEQGSGEQYRGAAKEHLERVTTWRAVDEHQRRQVLTTRRTYRKGERMSESKQQTPAQKMIGDFAPKLVELTDEVLFGDVWARQELSPRDRSLVTVAALIANGNTEQLTGHLNRARENGLSETELVEVITHLAFYAGWPRAMSAVRVAREVFKK